jgi:hypothetical protein
VLGFRSDTDIHGLAGDLEGAVSIEEVCGAIVYFEETGEFYGVSGVD